VIEALETAAAALDQRCVRCSLMPFASRFNPAVTTIHVPHRDLGFAAADLLVGLLAQSNAPNRRVLLPATLVVRESTAPPAEPGARA
jgi:DNA-binding LacI/PurR family transcriptional regulator